MKLIIASKEQYQALWSKVMPMQRITASMTTPSIVLPSLDATVICRDYIQIGSIADIPTPDPISLRWLTDIVNEKKYKEI